MSNNDLMRVCDECEHEFDVTGALAEKEKERVPGIGKVFVVGIQCPECDTFYFAGFTTEKLMRESVKLKEVLDNKPDSPHDIQNYLRRRLSYQKKFNKLNKTLAQRYGVALPKFPK